MGNQIKKYIVTEEYLRMLITSHLTLEALSLAHVGDWPYYDSCMYDYIMKCSGEDNKEYHNMTEIIENEMEKLEPIKEGEQV